MVSFDGPTKKPSYSSLMVAQAKQVCRSGGQNSGQSYDGSSFMSLPLEVRMKIWEAVLMAANRPIVVRDSLNMGLGDLAILRVCRSMHEEASTALNSVMCRRQIIFENFTFNPLPMMLESKSWASYERFSKEWTKIPCPFPTAFPTLGHKASSSRLFSAWVARTVTVLSAATTNSFHS